MRTLTGSFVLFCVSIPSAFAADILAIKETQNSRLLPTGSQAGMTS